MIYVQLLFIFFRLGLFTVGGGYAMLPLIQNEIESRGWITAQEFVDMIAVAEMTPGAIGVNTATFVGFRLAGVLGSIVATTGIALPSLFIVIAVSKVMDNLRNHPTMKAILYGIRPVVAGLITAAAVFIAEAALIMPVENVGASGPLARFDWISLVIAVAVAVAVRKYRLHPIAAILAAGVAGLVIF